MKKQIAVLAAAVMMFGTMSSMVQADGTREVLVTTTEELHAALADAKAGDEIIVREGLYQHDDWIGVWAVFSAEASGTAEQPIILRSEDPEHPAVLSGMTVDEKYALQIIGSYWEIRDLKLTTAGKGIFLEQSEHSIISGCEVYNIGDEAIHIIDNSSYNLVENCYIHDTGKLNPKYGEGVYIGSSYKAEGYGFDCHYNTVRNCKIGPNVTADHVDIKELTIGNVVEGCTFDGTGIAGENGGDSFVEIKGNNCIVRNNTGYRNNNSKILYAFDACCMLEGWGQNNMVYDNTVYLDSIDVYFFKEWLCPTQIFRNKIEPEGVTVSSSMTMRALTIDMEGDTTEDGIVNAEDAARLQDFLMARETLHISGENADMDDSSTLSAFDLAILKRKLIKGEINDKPAYSVESVEETPAAWRISDGLDERTVTFHLNALPGSELSTGWGYWDQNYVKEDGTTGKWCDFSLDAVTTDADGNAAVTVEVPAGVRRVMLEVYSYKNNSTTLDKDGVELVKTIAE